MRHYNSVFHQVLKHVPWSEFDRLAHKHAADFRVRRLSCKNQFLALLFGQLSGAVSLREIEAGLTSQQARLYHAGAKRAARSTLADANARRPWGVFGDLFTYMAANAGRSTRRKMGDAVRILDATRFRLSSFGAEWARFSNDACAAKLHLVYDPLQQIPLNAVITPGNVNDILPARELEPEPGVTYVFDLAYYHYSWWAKLDALGCRFVTRLKTSTPVTVTAELPVPEGGNILCDRIGFLPQRQARNRHNPLSDPVREIVVRISTGKLIRLVTNDLDAPADNIADLYKQRWQIELFFKWIKQNLKIKRFLGSSENAVRIQLYVALIAFLLLRLIHAAQTNVKQPVAFARLVRLNLMHRRPIDQLGKPKIHPPKDPRQMCLELNSC